MTISELQKVVHEQAVERGLYKGKPSVSNLLWHVREEAAEAIKAWHDYKDLDVHNECDGVTNYCIKRDFQCKTCPRRRPEGVCMELADVVIMTLSLCEHLGINLEAAIEEKMAYNAIRKR